MREVSYSGAAPAYQDLIAGRVDMMVDFLTVAAPRVTTGQLKGLAITARKRSPKIPDVPTLEEAGISGFQIGGWFGLLAPAGTPREVVMTMNTEVNRLLREPDVQKDLANLDVAIMGGSPEDFRAYLMNELKQWSALIDKLDLKRE
jgi:tripartite-type tricarboxylate transporter receptor subunit TctC